MRIADTLSVANFEASESLLPAIGKMPLLQVRGDAREMEFNSEHNLI